MSDTPTNRLTRLVKVGMRPEKPTVQVVFVHGLNEEWEKSWGFDQPISWKDYFELRVPDAALFSLDYQNAWTEWLGGAMPLSQRAINVLATLDAELDKNLPIVLIGHSYGGLLIKQMLRKSNEGIYPWVERQTQGTIFFAVPHNGASLADYIDGLRVILRRTKAIEELRSEEPQLLDLYQSFRARYEARRRTRKPIAVLAFTEKNKLKGVLVVKPSSADPGLTDVVPVWLDEHHNGTMLAPYPPDLRVTQVLALVSEVARTVRTSPVAALPEAEIEAELKQRAAARSTVVAVKLTGKRAQAFSIGAAVAGATLTIVVGIWLVLNFGSASSLKAPPVEAPKPVSTPGQTESATSIPGPSAGLTLALDWQPAFCEQRPDHVECVAPTSYYATHFSLQGLYSRIRGNEYCGVGPAIIEIDQSSKWPQLPSVDISSTLRSALDTATPGTAALLERHMWIKHGICLYDTPAQYFQTAVDLLGAINNSAVAKFFSSHVGLLVTKEDLRAAFDTAFGTGAGDRVAMLCISVNGRKLISRLYLYLAPPDETRLDIGALILAAAPMSSICDAGIVDAI